MGFGIESSSDYVRTRRRRSRKKFYFLVTLLLFIPLTILSFKMFLNSSNISVKDIPTPTPTQFPTPTKAVQSESLRNLVAKSLEGTKGSYGIAIVNLKTGESFFQNENMQFDTASIYKLWVMAEAYQKVQNGSWKLSDVLSAKVEDLNKAFGIDEESAERTEGDVTYTIENALTKMITISDNYSALLLTKNLRLSNVQSFLDEYGLNDSKVGTSGDAPTTTPYDTYLFLSMIYKNQIPKSEDMIALLKKQALNEKLPKYLPDNSVVAHKTGELGEFSHDAGIVFSENGDYIIVVMSKSNSIELANERIANLSKAVYEYFK